MRAAVAGATGFVGRALVAELVELGHEVVALSRHEADLPDAIVKAVDVGHEAALGEALDGCEAAYYLVHSLGGGDFRRRDLQLAEGFRRAAGAAGVRRIVYLGGLGDDPQSHHLASRQEVGAALGSAGVPVVELRASVILGAGSISFEILRYLTERLPVMVCPRWVRTPLQPIALRDALAYLTRSLEVAPGVYEIGGADVTTYRDMIATYARVRGLRRRSILDVPYLTPGLSSYWVDLVTPVGGSVSHALIESLTVEVVVHRGEKTAGAFGVEPVDSATAIEAALNDQARTIDDGLLSRERGLADGVYSERAAAPLSSDAAERAGPDFGHSVGSYPAYTSESWRVTRREPSRLVLRRRSSSFGETWLGFEVREAAIVAVGALRPKGLPGFLYAKLLQPFARRILRGLARRRSARAERL